MINSKYSLKLVLSAITLVTVTSALAAGKNTKNSAKSKAQEKARAAICKKLGKQADAICAESICADGINDGTWKSIRECVGASDYNEVAQDCELEERSNLVKSFNKKNPKAKLNCEE